MAQVCSRHGIENWGLVVYSGGQLQSGEGLGWVDGFSGVMDWGQVGTETVMETKAGRPYRIGSLGRLPREASPCSPQSFEGRWVRVMIMHPLTHVSLSMSTCLFLHPGMTSEPHLQEHGRAENSLALWFRDPSLCQPFLSFFPQSQQMLVPRPVGPAPNTQPIGE